jgi:hypothetical protein
LERLARAGEAVSEGLTARALARTLPVILVTGLATTAVVFTADFFDQNGKTVEVAALWAVALLVVIATSGFASTLSRHVVFGLRRWAHHRRLRDQEARMLAMVDGDPRVMADLLAARSRADWVR